MEKKAYLQWGSTDHENEYVITLHQDELTIEDVPSEWEELLRSLLGRNWGVAHRVDRIEVFPPELKQTPETDSRLTQALKSLIGENYRLIAISLLVE
jgi:hypothetical protein